MSEVTALREWHLHYQYDGVTMTGNLAYVDGGGALRFCRPIVLRARHGVFRSYVPTRADLFERADDLIGWHGENAWVRVSSDDRQGLHLEEWHFILPKWVRKKVR